MLNSRHLILGACGVFLLFGVGLFIGKLKPGLFNEVKKSEIISNFEEPEEKLKIEDKEIYTHDSGFSFSYPSNLEISEETPKGDEYYAVLYLKSPKVDEVLTISIKDTKVKNAASWIEDNLPQAKLSGATTIGEISAKQYAFTNFNKEFLKTLAIDLGVLYEITNPQDGGFWEETGELVASSFAFGEQAEEAPAAPVDNAIYEEEEVVE